MQTALLIRFAFVWFVSFRRISVIFILDTRHGGTSGTIDSLSISWVSHSTMVLIEPPPLLESVAGRKYHYPPAFHRPSGKLFRILKLHICRSLSYKAKTVMAYGFSGCRDFIPAAGLTYSRCWYSIFKMLKELLFSLHLYRGRSRTFNNRFLLRFQKFVKLAQNPTFLFVNVLLSGM